MKTLKIISTLLIIGVLPCAGFAQQATSNTSIAPGAVDKAGIAKKLANPITNVIAVPLQYEFSRGV
jgi:hypothetical protein